MFYDEQPTRYAQTVAQRVRWIKGYFGARKKYIPAIKEKRDGVNVGSLRKEQIGVRPAILAVIGAFLIVLGGMMVLSWRGEWGWALSVLGIAIVVLYLVLMGVTLHILRQEKIDLSRRMKLKVIFFNPLYLVTYVPCAIEALLKREVGLFCCWRKGDFAQFASELSWGISKFNFGESEINIFACDIII